MGVYLLLIRVNWTSHKVTARECYMPKLPGWTAFFLRSFLTVHEQQSTFCDKSQELGGLVSFIRLVDGNTGSIVGYSTQKCPLQAGEWHSTPENVTAVLKLLPDLEFWYFCWKYGTLSSYPPKLLLPLLLETIFCLFPLHVLSFHHRS